MSGLPKGWACTTLGEVIELKYGKALPDRVRSGAGFPVFGSNGIVGYHKPALTTGETIIVGRKGSVGEVNFSKIPCSPIDTTYFVDKFPSKNPRYWYYKLRQLNLGKLNKSTAIPGFNRGDAYGLMIMMPPVAEQKRIADKLDTMLAQIDTCRKRLTSAQSILERFRQSVLVSAISGNLTCDWRIKYPQTPVDVNSVVEELFFDRITAGNFGKIDHRTYKITKEEENVVITNNCAWPMVRIGSICACIVPNRNKPKSFSGNFHWLLTQHFDDNKIFINYENVKNGLTEDEVREFSAKIIPVNGVVMTCIGRLGLSAVLDEAAVINQQLHAFLPNKYVLPEFLAYAIRANKKYYDEISTSTTVSYLNKTACNSLPIPLPKIDEQRELIRRVETLFAFADRLEARLATACTAVDRLTPALLAKAFRGELVPQDPADEPASELLARLATSRAAETAKPRRARTAKD